MDAAEKRASVSVTALPGRGWEVGERAWARRGVMKGGRLCSEGDDERRIPYVWGICDCI